MPKKRKTSSTTKTRSTKKKEKIEDKIVENLVELQKVHLNLAEKFDGLTKEISNLLALFEMAARNFAKQSPGGEFEKDKQFLEKIDRLLDQNKTIAKGLTLMEDRMRARVYGAAPEKKEEQEQQSRAPISSNRPLPRF